MNILQLVLQINVLYIGFLAAKHDLKTYLIPNRFTFAILLCSAFSQFLAFRGDVLLSGILITVFHLLPSLLIRNSIGMGDVKLIAAISLGLGSAQSTLIWISVCYILGICHGFWLKIAKKTSRIPFAVSIYGAFVLVCVGEWARVAMDYSR